MKDRLPAILVALLGVAIWIRSNNFPTLDDGHPGPALFPRLIAIGLILAGIGLLFMKERSEESRDEAENVRFGWLRLLLALALVAVFPWMRTYLGFVVALSILGLAVGLVLKTRLLVAVPVVVVSSALIYWLFTGLLGVPL